MDKLFEIGAKKFVLDQAKAEDAYAAKRIINGRQTMTFNLLPLKYQWAYDIYRDMKANHWEPEDITMAKDIEQWKGSDLSDVERWIIRMGIGYFSAAEGIVGDNVQHVVRELVTAPELKLVLGRHAHEENIHADSLLYMISSLGINPHECEAMFEDVPTIVRKNEFVSRVSRGLRRDMDLSKTNLSPNKKGRGQHPNSRKNLKPYEKGVSGNPSGKPKKVAQLKEVLDWWGDLTEYDNWSWDNYTNRQMVVKGIWKRATSGNRQDLDILLSLGLLDSDKFKD